MTIARLNFASIALGLTSAVTLLPVEAFANCQTLQNAAQRLACYDREAGRKPFVLTDPAKITSTPIPLPTSTIKAPLDTTSPPVQDTFDGMIAEQKSAPLSKDSAIARAVRDGQRSLGTTLSDRWELEPDADRGRFVVRPYKPMYLMPAVWTTHANHLPASPNPSNALSSPLSQQNSELKFQISLKSKVWQDPIGQDSALWLGYTQTSYWQVYDGSGSRPFRETNYEPEVMLIFKTNYSLMGWQGRIAGLSLNHMSNGRGDPLSRSWNRVIGMVGLERDNWMVMLRPWWRLQEGQDDNNPDIQNYYGRAELIVVRKTEGHQMSVLARHTLRSGNDNHASLQFDWAFPVSSYLKGYLQLFSGYGDSLIDYNFRQTRFGIGISITQWL